MFSTDTAATTPATVPSQAVWPLPATRMPHACLSWSEYQEWQAAHLGDTPDTASALALVTPLSVSFQSTIAPTPCPAWPLPATQAPGAHLTWAEWSAPQPTIRPDDQPVTRAA